MPDRSASKEPEKPNSVETSESSNAGNDPKTPAEPTTERPEHPNPGAATVVPSPPFVPSTKGKRNTKSDEHNPLVVTRRSRSVPPSKVSPNHEIEEMRRGGMPMGPHIVQVEPAKKRVDFRSWMRGRPAGHGRHKHSRNSSFSSTSSGSSSRSSSRSTDTEVRSTFNHIEKSAEATSELVKCVIELQARIEKLENPGSKGRKKKAYSSSSGSDPATSDIESDIDSDIEEIRHHGHKHFSDDPDRTFELTTMFVCDSDAGQRDRFFDFETCYPFIRVLWDRSDADLPNPMTEEQNPTLVPGSVNILHICMDSPVILEYFETLSDTVVFGENPPSRALQPNETIRDGTIVFRKPFRCLFEHRSRIEEKVRALQEERAFLHFNDPELKNSQDANPAHITIPELGSSTTTEKQLSGNSNVSPEDTGGRSSDEKVELVAEPPNQEHNLLVQLEYLLAFMEEHLSAQLQLFRDARAGKLETIQFQDAWMLFMAKDLVYTSIRPSMPEKMPPRPGMPMATRERPGSDTPQAYRVVTALGGRPLARAPRDNRKKLIYGYSPLEIMTYYIDFDGTTYGVMHTMHKMFPWVGNKDIRSIGIYPLNYAQMPPTFRGGLNATGEADILEFLQQRGHDFLQVSDASHKFYDGLTIGKTKEEISTPVIIDFKLAYRNSLQPSPSFKYPDWQEMVERISRQNELMEVIANYKHFVRRGKGANGDWYRSYQSRLTEKARSDLLDAFDPEGIQKLTEMMENAEIIQLLPGMVHGFALRMRKWVSLDLSLLQPANDQAGWDNLILPPGHKDMVQAVVETHTAGSRSTTAHVRRATEVDLVRGKGKGCIILLHGEPGVGKTSTAECVAAYTKRPLFSVTCGDIGYEPSDVEKNIDAHFSLAQKWGCVVLLDEADVFLAKRNREDVKRNGLVSVFLRTLEYYQGILFLTTNRVGSIDDAFRSRLHLTLYYPKLGYSQTKSIWKVNLRRLNDLNDKRREYGQEPIDIHKRKIMKFAKRHWKELSWNGRQIRNAFQTAVALAEFDANKAAGDAHTAAAAATLGANDDSKERPPVQPVMSTKQFQIIAKATMEFDNYLFLTHGNSDVTTNARRDHYRVDDYEFRDGGKSQHQHPHRSKRHGGNHKLSSGSSSSSDSSSSSESEDGDDLKAASGADSEDENDSDSGSSSSSEDDKKRKKKKSGSSSKDKGKSKKEDDKGKKHKSKKEKH